MATFITTTAVITAILLTLAVLLKINRTNDYMVRHLPAKVQTAGRRLPLLNTAGRWLALTAGLATAPLVMALIFTPQGSPEWIINLGVMGLIAFPVAGLLSGFVLVRHCVARRIRIGRLITGESRRYAKKVSASKTVKTLAQLTGITLLVIFVPAVLFIAGFLVLIWFGLDGDEEKETIEETNYVQEGIDYDFYYGTNEYNSFPD